MENYSKLLIVRPLVITACFILTSSTACASNILVYGIVGSYSQRISIWPLVEGLVEKGHNVTYISSYDTKTPDLRIYDYAPKLWKEKMGPWEDHINFYNLRKQGLAVRVRGWFEMQFLGATACETLYNDEEFVDWVKSSTFDLVIVDSLMNECAYGMVHLWNAKLIIYSTMSAMGWFFDQHGLALETSSVSDQMYNFPVGNGMTFWQRFINTMTPLAWIFSREFFHFPRLEEVTKQALSLREVPSFSEIEKNASLVMITTHFSLEGPKSLPPNTVAVQGVTVASKVAPLPKEMEEFIEKSKEGFVYISFGTVAEFTNFDKKVQKEFIQAITDFPNIGFIWKSTNKIDANLPDHVMVTSWAPQQSLLAHPKIKAFISHTGMGSTTETIHFAVPVISLPVLSDQDMNGHGIASKSAGIKLEITTLKRHELEHAIKEVVYNPKYKRAMERLSKIFKDRPVPPTQDALWWVEYVLRHEDTNEFLRPPSVHQPWWVKRQIDVWLVATVIVLILTSFSIYLLFFILKTIVGFMILKNGNRELSRRKFKQH